MCVRRENHRSTSDQPIQLWNKSSRVFGAKTPKYMIELLRGSLVHVHPAHDTADPAGLLDLRLREFFLPPDDCVSQQLLNMDKCMVFSYTPELSRYLCKHQMAWDQAQAKGLFWCGR